MSAKGVLILDTSILCVWLKVPGMECCGADEDRWDYSRVDSEIRTAVECGYTLVLPLATLIESGNHIARIPSLRYETAQRLAEVIAKAADRASPWAAFTDQSELWAAKNLQRLSEEWPELAKRRLSIGDATIAHVRSYYSQMGYKVELLTGDRRLAEFKAPPPPLVPRRRSG